MRMFASGRIAISCCPANQRAARRSKAAARAVTLDMTAFDRCLSAGSGRAGVEVVTEDATRLGVKTTPTSSVNGRELEGQRTLEGLAVAIPNELPE